MLAIAIPLVCMKPCESVKELQILCGRLDLKHLIDLSKMRLYDSVSTCPSDILRCCLLKALFTVKKMFYFIPMMLAQDVVGFNSVFSKLKSTY